MTTSAIDYFEAMQDEMVAWRTEMHQNPELAYEEVWTSDFVAAKLESFGLKPQRGFGKTGLVATIGQGAPAIGLRADMDALPIDEKTNLPHASKVAGKMHACGHDGHMTMLLAAAKWFSENPDAVAGTLHFIFQPAEEGFAGAEAMMKDGLFDQFPVDEVYGLHNWPGLTEGTFAARVGPQMAAFDVFEIKIEGQGAHAAMPHLGQDVLTAAAAVQSQCQAIVARMIDPLDTAVVSITEFHGGDAWNVLPSEARLAGCTRHMSPEAQDIIEARMGDVCAGVARSFGLDVTLDYQRRYPATVNTARETGVALEAARGVAGDEVTDTINPSMASEDFAFMLQEKPGCYIWLGAGSTEGGCTLHSPTYRFNDAILARGAAWWVSVVMTALEKRGQSKAA